MRSTLGDGYVEAIRGVHPDVPDTIDLVMYWWHKASQLVKLGSIKRFGLITTNSITQAFNRGVVQQALTDGVSIVFAVPDHPWVESEDGAAVRVAMTVVSQGETSGRLCVVECELPGIGDGVETLLSESRGTIHANLAVGAALTACRKLRANQGLCQQGVKLVGDGFLISRQDIGTYKNSMESVVKPYISNRDVVQKSRDLFVIDFHGFDLHEARLQHPEAYQRVHDTVRAFRMENRDSQRKRNWWLFGRSNERMRASIKGLNRYIVTPEVAKYRPFLFVGGKTIPDASLYVIGSDDAYVLGVLSSRLHVRWSLAAGGSLEDRPRYQNGPCFEPFPFPDANSQQRERIRKVAELLDQHRKKQQAKYPSLTVTKIYNVLAKIMAHEQLEAPDRIAHEFGLTSILLELHDDLDAAVFDAYGWPYNLTDDEIL